MLNRKKGKTNWMKDTKENEKKKALSQYRKDTLKIYEKILENSKNMLIKKENKINIQVKYSGK